MRIEITGSKIHRVWQCPASAILPQIDREDDGHEVARERGSKIHAYLERVHLVGEELALAECTDEELRPLLRAIDVAALPVHLATEVAFAWNWRTRTARELGRNLGRGYQLVMTPPTADEIPCTLDLVGEQELAGGRRRGYVGDYKSGHAKLPSPERNGQLLLGALCARAVYRLDDCVVELLHIHSDGDHHKVRRIVDEWDLDTFADELARSMALVDYWEMEHRAGRAVSAHEGPHCDYCGAWNVCPAKTALIRSLPKQLASLGITAAEGSDTELLIAPGAITAANAADVWLLLERLGDVIDRAKQQICGIASIAGDIPLPDGRVIGRLITERRAVDGKIGAEVLEERFGRATRDDFVELKLSISAIQQAVVRHLKPGQKVTTREGTGALDVVLAEIDRRGGVAINRTDSIKPHVPRKKNGR